MEEQRISNFNGAHQRARRRIRINVSQSRQRPRYSRNTMLMPYHTIFVFLIPLLVGVLEVNVQGRITTKAWIEEHPGNMCTFLLALLIYCIAYLADMKYSQRLQIFTCISVISGTLSSVSLVSMILPHPFGYFSFILWAFILLLVATLRVWNRFRRIKQQQLLPL